VHVNSNSFVTFGAGAFAYSGLGASVPALPTLHIGSSDNYITSLYAGVTAAGDYRVHYENTGGASWELTFERESGDLVLDIGSTSPSGALGLSDGAGSWVVHATAFGGALTANTRYRIRRTNSVAAPTPTTP